MSARKAIIEKELEVKIPHQYEAFLEKYGIYAPTGIEVYGITEDLLHYDGIPCVIGATKIYRKKGDIPHRFLVIHHTGVEDELVCLDTENEKIYSISRALGNRKIADSFDEWFENYIVQKEKYRKSQNKYSKARRHVILDRKQLD